MEARDELTQESAEEFGELLRFTVAGYVAGMSLGLALDQLGLGRSGLGQWAVRTLSGEGESIFEGLFAARKRLLGSGGSLAEAYGWGKFLGMCAPWIIDAASRLAGVDIYGVPGFRSARAFQASSSSGGAR
jgi:hypothetical protein